MGCLPGLPLTVEGPGPVLLSANEGLGASEGLGANKGVDASTTVEGGADEATSPSMKSSGSKWSASSSCSSSCSSSSSCPCCCYCCSSSNHAGASSMIGNSTSTLHLDNTSILSKQMASTSGDFSTCFIHS